MRVFDAARAGEPEAVQGIRVTVGWLGRGLAILINIFNPAMIVLGTPWSGAFDLIELPLQVELKKYALPAALRHARICVPHFGDDSSLMGAAELAFEHLLDDPTQQWARRTG